MGQVVAALAYGAETWWRRHVWQREVYRLLDAARLGAVRRIM